MDLRRAVVTLLPLIPLTLLVGCSDDAPSDAAPTRSDGEASGDAVAFVPPEPPPIEWYDLPTDRRARAAEAAAVRDEKTRETVRSYADALFTQRSCAVADGLVGTDGRLWFEALGQALDDADLDPRVSARGIAAGCLLYAIDSGHVPAQRRDQAWGTLDLVVGHRVDWPEPRAASVTPVPEATPLSGGVLDRVVRVAGGAPDPVSTEIATPASPRLTAIRADVGVYLSILARLDAQTGMVKIPREPPEGWNAASKRLFAEMPAGLRSLVDTEDLRARASSHAAMRGW